MDAISECVPLVPYQNVLAPVCNVNCVGSLVRIGAHVACQNLRLFAVLIPL